MFINDLVPDPKWEPIPQIELSTIARGGVGGSANAQAQALLNNIEQNKKHNMFMFASLAEAEAAALVLPDGAHISVSGESQGQANAGIYQVDGMAPLVLLNGYADLLSYSGKAKFVMLTEHVVSGIFKYDPSLLNEIEVGIRYKHFSGVGAWVRQTSPDVYSSRITGVKEFSSVAAEDNRKIFQESWEACAAANKRFIFDGDYTIATKDYTYQDGLKRLVGLTVPSGLDCIWLPGKGKLRIPAQSVGMYYVINTYLADNFKLWTPEIYGDKDQHAGTDGEWGHCINLVNSKNFIVYRPQLFDAWGDGLYVGVEYWAQTNKQLENGVVVEPYIQNGSRNGISICSGINVIITNPTVKGVQRIWPKSGIDVEPESAGATKAVLKGVKVTGTTTIEDTNTGVLVYFSDNASIENMDLSFGDIEVRDGTVAFQTRSHNTSIHATVKIGNITHTRGSGAVAALFWQKASGSISIGDVTAVDSRRGLPSASTAEVSALMFGWEGSIPTTLGNIKVGNVTSGYSSDNPSRLFATVGFWVAPGAAGVNTIIDNVSVGSISGEEAIPLAVYRMSVNRNVTLGSMKDYRRDYYLYEGYESYSPKIILKANSSVMNYKLSGRIKKDIEIFTFVKSGWGNFDIEFPDDVTVVTTTALGATRKLRTILGGQSMKIKWLDDSTVAIVLSDSTRWIPM